GQLVYYADTAKVDVPDAAQRDVESRIRRIPDRGQRLALVFVVGKEVQAVLQDRTAERPADLLVRVGQHLLQHRIRGVELAVAEVADQRSGKHVGPRFRDRIDLH